MISKSEHRCQILHQVSSMRWWYRYDAFQDRFHPKPDSRMGRVSSLSRLAFLEPFDDIPTTTAPHMHQALTNFRWNTDCEGDVDLRCKNGKDSELHFDKLFSWLLVVRNVTILSSQFETESVRQRRCLWYRNDGKIVCWSHPCFAGWRTRQYLPNLSQSKCSTYESLSGW